MNTFYYTTFIQYQMFAYHCYDNKTRLTRMLKSRFRR